MRLAPPRSPGLFYCAPHHDLQLVGLHSSSEVGKRSTGTRSHSLALAGTDITNELLPASRLLQSQAELRTCPLAGVEQQARLMESLVELQEQLREASPSITHGPKEAIPST